LGDNTDKIIQFFKDWENLLLAVNENSVISFKDFSMPIPSNAYEYIYVSIICGGYIFNIGEKEITIPLYIPELGFKGENRTISEEDYKIMMGA
tara:strand:+ start:6732 stop:7010 length:279 start_codon:yes stop_codon:yes gene_type:complete